MEIKEWALAYVKHRDLFEKAIENIEEQEQGFLIHRKDGLLMCYTPEIINEALLPQLAGRVLIITRNLKENLKFIVQHWKSLAENDQLRIVFANTRKNEKWVLVPHGHATVADPASLKLGLQAMFDAVSEG